jgi:hypothetical protein
MLLEYIPRTKCHICPNYNFFYGMVDLGKIGNKKDTFYRLLPDFSWCNIPKRENNPK